jgi:hypothetical protein
MRVPLAASDGGRSDHLFLPRLSGARPRTMGRVSGTRRWALTAALFAVALVLLLVAIFTHSAVPLFVMWVPLLVVPIVLGRPDPGLREREQSEQPGASPQGAGSGTDAG